MRDVLERYASLIGEAALRDVLGRLEGYGYVVREQERWSLTPLGDAVRDMGL